MIDGLEMIEVIQQNICNKEENMDTTIKKIVYYNEDKLLLLDFKKKLSNDFELYLTHTFSLLLSLLERIVPDLILLDYDMKSEEGIDIIRLIKSNKFLKSTPVIFFTELRENKSIIKGLGQGAIDFIYKPFTEERLIEIVDIYLNPDKMNDYKPKILAVDDNPTLLKLLGHHLSSQYRVFTISDPENIDQFLQNVTPDLILLDYHMPVINGLELIIKLRATAEFATIPIIFKTSESKAEKIKGAMEQGASDYLIKPVHETVLRERIATHIAETMMKRNIVDIY